MTCSRSTLWIARPLLLFFLHVFLILRFSIILFFCCILIFIFIYVNSPYICFFSFIPSLIPFFVSSTFSSVFFFVSFSSVSFSPFVLSSFGGKEGWAALAEQLRVIQYYSRKITIYSWIISCLPSSTANAGHLFNKWRIKCVPTLTTSTSSSRRYQVTIPEPNDMI